MLARLCGCEHPLLLEPPACHRCGRDTAPRVTASTWNLAIAIAEVTLGASQAGTRTAGVHARRGENANKGGM